MKDGAGLKDAILSILPSELASDVKDSIEAKIQRQFEQMNLVSRDEFEIQQKVLSKTRAKLDALEQVLAEMEMQLGKR